jgi:glutamyl-tRNA synthetase/nondiscriminating glutamyl-tRNA synthetase
MKVRFPPSPTGPMHIGTSRAMLFNFLFARGNNGKIVFRSEDTDKERSKVEFEEEILEGLKWLSLEFDEGVFRQSERDEIYEEYFEKLKASGKIYPCFCSSEDLEAEREMQKAQKLPPRYSGKCRDLSEEEIAKLEAEGKNPVWRFRVDKEKEIVFKDLVRGEIKELGKNIADFVIRKADKQFLYHFTVVVDDSEMGITHVIRGEDGSRS